MTAYMRNFKQTSQAESYTGVCYFVEIASEFGSGMFATTTRSDADELITRITKAREYAAEIIALRHAVEKLTATIKRQRAKLKDTKGGAK